MAGLVGPGSSVLWSERPDWRLGARIVFWIVGFLTSPFVLFGTLFVLFGDDFGDRVAGIVMLVLFLPGLVALYRWAHPRR